MSWFPLMTMWWRAKVVFYVLHDSMCVIRLLARDMTPYLWHNSPSTIICWRAKLVLYMSHDSTCVTWLLVCIITPYLWHDSLICVTWPIHICDTTHSCVCHDSFICVSLLRTCDMTHRWWPSGGGPRLLSACHMTPCDTELIVNDYIVEGHGCFEFCHTLNLSHVESCVTELIVNEYIVEDQGCFPCATWLLIFYSVTWLLTYAMTQCVTPYVCHDNAWLLTYAMTQCESWLLMYAMTQCESVMCVAWLNMCEGTHTYVWCDSSLMKMS